MSQVQRKPMTPGEFLTWESAQELKWEFDGFEPVAMTGGTQAHSVVQTNLTTALTNQLRGKPCRVYGNDLKVRTGVGYRYPDASVSCTPFPINETVVAQPVVIFEVLSSSTAETDKTVKLAEYLALPSVQRYVMLEQGHVFATIVTRTATGWGLALAKQGDKLAMPEIGVEIAMDELYAGLELPV
jgi:Uma2 family endonuclease